MKQRVNLITLGVTDLGRSREFYEALGWVTGAEPGDDVVFFQAGEGSSPTTPTGPSPRTAASASPGRLEETYAG